jgi:hypothetical protein
MAGMDCEPRYGILDAERELIAAILADNRAYKAVRHLLRAEHFLAPAHQRQFARIAASIERGEPVTVRMPDDRGRPMIGLPAIDPLDHALMIYGSFLGREAVMIPTGRSAVVRSVALDEIGSSCE